MAPICWILLINLTLSASFIPSVYGISETEVLIAFKKRLSDPDNVLQSWDPNLVNPCTYFHITCNQNNLVTRVDLGGMRLSGSLAPELGQLSALENLVLGRNSISGTIPAELSNLQKLAFLDLSENKLTGKVPAQIGKMKSLRRAYFSNNNNLCWDFWPTPVFVGSYTLCKA